MQAAEGKQWWTQTWAAVKFNQFGKLLYVMVRRLPNRFISERSGYFRFLCVVYCFVISFVHQNVKDFIHKNLTICIYKFINQSFNYHTQLWQIGNLVNVILKETKMKQKYKLQPRLRTQSFFTIFSNVFCL